MFRVGIVGHRYLTNQETVAFVYEQCAAFLKQAKIEHPDLIVISAIAEGADTLFAEVALSLDIPLEIVRPFHDYVSDFTSFLSRERYESLRAAASKETKLNYQERSNTAYKAAMNWIVSQSDVLVVAWDGLAAAGEGGTGEAVNQARKRDMQWLHIDVSNLSVAVHPAGSEMSKGSE